MHSPGNASKAFEINAVSLNSLIPPATLRQGSVFTSVCHSVHRHPPRADTPQTDTRLPPRPETATAADGTRPTGMHSCNTSVMYCPLFFSNGSSHMNQETNVSKVDDWDQWRCLNRYERFVQPFIIINLVCVCAMSVSYFSSSNTISYTEVFASVPGNIHQVLNGGIHAFSIRWISPVLMQNSLCGQFYYRPQT